jgi:hypothetical protein
MELVIDATGTKGAEKFTPDSVGKLARVDKNIRAGHRGEANNIRRAKAKKN